MGEGLAQKPVLDKTLLSRPLEEALKEEREVTRRSCVRPDEAEKELFTGCSRDQKMSPLPRGGSSLGAGWQKSFVGSPVRNCTGHWRTWDLQTS